MDIVCTSDPACFHGHGTQNVSNVQILGCDLEDGYLFETMEALDVPLAYTLAQPSLPISAQQRSTLAPSAQQHAQKLFDEMPTSRYSELHQLWRPSNARVPPQQQYIHPIHQNHSQNTPQTHATQ
ncbi:Os11g0235700 [Oryza sativa Japonica Group]|uniref:Os11g0235700 protein n=2 Tax=Oryza sativa subsp. japonica TaxID=39947 RepID=C7J904_ORYSJ|nr:Os11g0235700 [Oryza sativa Japonica Group]BAT13351.1 Os11g0235700 [Oryza sativa Japonica Group]|eukprot:NP_001176447.1 Os11g0235700 [Oryza sativa Japonica Group]